MTKEEKDEFVVEILKGAAKAGAIALATGLAKVIIDKIGNGVNKGSKVVSDTILSQKFYSKDTIYSWCRYLLIQFESTGTVNGICKKRYNELIEYTQNQLNAFNNTQLLINFYPELDETKDVATQLIELTEKFNELKTYLIDGLGGL